MKKVRKQTQKLIEELQDLKNNRESIDDFNFAFLINFSENSRITHSLIRKDSDKLLDIAFRQYVVFLISCWETYFRDTFVYVHTIDDVSIEKLVCLMKIDDSLLNLSEITLPELLSKSFNFQNLEDLESAYNSFWGANFLNSICETKTDVFGINGQISESFSIGSLFPEWESTVSKAFSMRHKVIHDANYRPDIDISFIQQAEAIFLFIPQLTTYFIAKRFNLKHIELSNGEFSVPYIFTMQDILSNDWMIVEQ